MQVLPRQTLPLGWFRETVRHRAFSQRPEQLPKVVQKELKTCVPSSFISYSLCSAAFHVCPGGAWVVREG